jgi:hypothetical protein
MATAWISAGRNVGDTPMPAPRWDALKLDLVATLTDLGGQVIFRGEGDGIWEGRISEQAVAIGAIVDPAIVSRLRPLLGFIATNYQQDAIGLTIQNTDTLVRG